jgi:hypothetical protein
MRIETCFYQRVDVINILAKQQGYSPFVWIAVGAQLLFFMVLNFSFGMFFITIGIIVILYSYQHLV